jgi:hypothetical protein
VAKRRSIIAQSCGGATMRGDGEEANQISEAAQVRLLELATARSVIVGAVLGPYVNFSRWLPGCILAFAAGSLIALAIDLGFEGAHSIARHGADVHLVWRLIAGRLALGAVAKSADLASCSATSSTRSPATS